MDHEDHRKPWAAGKRRGNQHGVVGLARHPSVKSSRGGRRLEAAENRRSSPGTPMDRFRQYCRRAT